MDFITHSLIGVGAARLLARDASQRPQFALAGLLGSLLPDADTVLALNGLETYGRYHRVVSHSLLGLTTIAVTGAAFAFALNGISRVRHFGWFVVPNHPDPEIAPPRIAYPKLFIALLLAALLHLCFDLITGYGNLYPLWPWNTRWEASLRLTASFDMWIFIGTLLWFGAVRITENMTRKQEIGWAFVFYSLVFMYLLMLNMFGRNTTY